MILGEFNAPNASVLVLASSDDFEGLLVTAFYDEKGQLLNSQHANIQQKLTELTFQAPANTKSARYMLINDFVQLKPLAKRV